MLNLAQLHCNPPIHLQIKGLINFAETAFANESYCLVAFAQDWPVFLMKVAVLLLDIESLLLGIEAYFVIYLFELGFEF